jgi:predicted dehydrogenase
VAVSAGPAKVALVGCGAVSRLYYAPSLQELEKVNLLQVKTLYDPHHENAAYLAQRFPRATRVRDLAQLGDLGLDLAIIASPPRYHAEQTIQLLRSGLSVLCEKPMAATVAEGEAMVQAAAAAKRLLAIGLHRRLFPAARAIREILALGTLGEVRSFSFSEGHYFRWPAQSASFFQKSIALGGVLIDIGVHVLDLIVWWFGQPVDVFYEDDALGGIEANCRIALKLARGCSGEVRLSRDWTLPNHYVIQCSEGWLGWSVNEANSLQIGLANTAFALTSQVHLQRTENRVPGVGPPGYTFQQSFVEQLRNVVAAIQGTEQLVIPGEQGLPSLRLIEYCYRHRNLMPMGWLGDGEYIRAQQIGQGARRC